MDTCRSATIHPRITCINHRPYYKDNIPSSNPRLIEPPTMEQPTRNLLSLATAVEQAATEDHHISVDSALLATEDHHISVDSALLATEDHHISVDSSLLACGNDDTLVTCSDILNYNHNHIDHLASAASKGEEKVLSFDYKTCQQLFSGGLETGGDSGNSLCQDAVSPVTACHDNSSHHTPCQGLSFTFTHFPHLPSFYNKKTFWPVASFPDNTPLHKNSTRGGSPSKCKVTQNKESNSSDNMQQKPVKQCGNRRNDTLSQVKLKKSVPSRLILKTERSALKAGKTSNPRSTSASPSYKKESSSSGLGIKNDNKINATDAQSNDIKLKKTKTCKSLNLLTKSKKCHKSPQNLKKTPYMKGIMKPRSWHMHGHVKSTIIIKNKYRLRSQSLVIFGKKKPKAFRRASLGNRREASLVRKSRIRKHTSKKGGMPRAKSTHSTPTFPQTRTLRANMSSPIVHKTHSDTSLVGSLGNLAISTSSTAIASHSGPLSRKHNSAGGRKEALVEIARSINIKQMKNIVVMAGAGISTPSGIPDFRTPGTGLYDNLQKYSIPYPQAIFDINYFERHPKPFYTLAKELYPSGKYRPNYIHYFLRLLHEKGLLLRLYTQNIDGLEKMAGLPTEKVIEAHGTFMMASCIRCKQGYPQDKVKESIFNDKLPRCKRNGCSGLVKPDIVFFGENLPKRFYYYLRDFPQADLLIVMGTSLEVEPFASIVDSTRIYIPRILFNREAVGPFEKKRRMSDYVVAGDLIEEVRAFVRLLGWSVDMEKLISEEQKRLESLTELEKGISQEEILRNQLLVRPASCTDTVSTTSLETESLDTTDSSSQSESKSSSGSGVTKVKRKPNKARAKVTKHSSDTRTLKPQSQSNQPNKPSITMLQRPSQGRLSISARPQLGAKPASGLLPPKPRILPKLAYSHKSNMAVSNQHRKKAESSSEESSESSEESSGDD